MGLTLLDIAMRPNQGKIYGPRGEVAHTYWQPSPLLPVIEALSQRNKFLQDVQWERRISPILRENGEHYLMEIP